MSSRAISAYLFKTDPAACEGCERAQEQEQRRKVEALLTGCDLRDLWDDLCLSSNRPHGKVAGGMVTVEKCMYDDVETDRTLMQSPVEKCMYDDLEENPLSTPIENSSFIDKDS